MSAVVASNAKQIRAIQKLLTPASSRRSAPLPRAAVDLFLQLPAVRSHSAAYLDAILRIGYKQKTFALCELLRFLRGLPNPDHQLNGCWILHQVDVVQPTGDHSLALAFFVNELRQKLQNSPLKIRVDQFWHDWFSAAIRALVLGHSVSLETFATYGDANEQELLYAPASEPKLDEHQRRVFTWRKTSEPQDNTDLSRVQWRFVPGNDEKTWFHIVNATNPNEYLCVADIQMSKDNPDTSNVALVRCCGEAPNDPQSEWEIRARGGRDVIELFNCDRSVYLATTDFDEDYDNHYRSVFMLPQDSATLDNAAARRWRLAV